MEEPVIIQFMTPFMTNPMMSIDAIHKINKIIEKDQQKQQKDQIKKNKIINKLIKEHKQINKQKIIIDI